MVYGLGICGKTKSTGTIEGWREGSVWRTDFDDSDRSSRGQKGVRNGQFGS